MYVFKRFFFCLMAISFCSTTNAQNDDWVSLLQGPNPNFYEVQAAFNEAFSDGVYAKGTGWKQYKRWEMYYADRIDKSGNLQNKDEVMQSVRSYINANAAKAYSVGTGNWQELGPVAAPANGTGQPNGNGRVNCVAFHPTDANTIYAGSPSGGFWVSNDDGGTWTKRVDGLVRLGVSSIVVHPTVTSTIYIGTGDRDGGDAPGYGVYRSLDGGLNWAPHNNGMGNRTVNEIIMHPTNSNIIIAATDNGIYRTTNAGNNWVRTLTNSHCFDIAMHPTDPNIIYSTRTSTYRSIDNGVTWAQISSATGLNPGGHNKIALAVSADSPNKVYALASGGSGFVGCYQSTDSGVTWTQQSDSPNLSGYSATGNDTASQSFYDHTLTADPNDANTIYFGGINVWKSTNSGVSWSIVAHWVGSGGAAAVHADQHYLAYSPTNGGLYIGNDGGVYKSVNGGTNWANLSSGLAIAQVYKLGVSQTEEDLAINGYQDNGTSVYSANGGWRTEIGGDGFECAIDPTDENYIYGSLYYGEVLRSTNKGFSFSTIADGSNNSPAGGLTETGAFSAPFTLDPNNGSTMYLGMKNVWRSTNLKAGTPAYTQISNWSNNNLRDIAVSPANSDRILVASSNGDFYRSTNATAANPAWTNITGNLISGSTVKDIAYHPTDANIVYIAQGNDIYRSTDNGGSWVNFSGTLPNISLNCIVFDANSAVEATYVGMDVGVYYRDNTMGDWSLYMTGLPNVEITDLEIYIDAVNCGGSIYASSYGAGMWKSDLKDPGNIAPLACFELSNTTLCGSSEIELQDKSSFTPTAWAWTVTPATHSFVNGTTAASQNPTVSFDVAGAYTIELTATNGNGSNTKMENVNITVTASEDLPLDGDFESAADDYVIGNPDAGTTWEETAAVSAYGVGSNALYINNFSYNAAGQVDYYTSDLADLTGVADATFEFDVAYAPYSASFSDGLRVEVSADCGTTWATIYNESGLDLSTNGGNYVTGAFTPTNAEWRSESVSLAAYANQFIQLRLVGVNGYGNNLYLDNINLTTVTALPIELRKFTGTHIEGRGNELIWTMDDEEPGLTFDVQRFHAQTSQWRTIGNVTADNTKTYDLMDVYPEFGSNVYRLAMLQDGELKFYSDLVEITIKQDLQAVRMFPNPTTDIISLQTESETDGIQTLQVADVTGRLVMLRTIEIPKGQFTQTIDLSNLVTGVYFIQVGEHKERVVKH